MDFKNEALKKHIEHEWMTMKEIFEHMERHFFRHQPSNGGLGQVEMVNRESGEVKAVLPAVDLLVFWTCLEFAFTFLSEEGIIESIVKPSDTAHKPPKSDALRDSVEGSRKRTTRPSNES